MEENKIIRVKVSADPLISGETDWARVDAMSDEEVNQAALSDPDAQPTPIEMLKKFRRVTSTQGVQGK
jgi:putative transcriptional regulator